MRPSKLAARWLWSLAAAATLFAILATLGIALFVIPHLPSIDSLRDVRLQVPLKIYSRDMKLMAEFGEMRRAPLEYAQIPPMMIRAVLAAEDDRFFEHPGVDYQGLLRAVFYLVRTGEKGQGGSTITMQVARNFFLSNEKTYLRKLNEILLAFKIEGQLGKEEILKLYLNKIYLGNRAYGVAAAAQVYYGLPVDKLSVAQVAMIAGLPKAPSKYNPIVNPSRALKRRNYVLGRMHELGAIDDAVYQQAMNTADDASLHGLSQEVVAPYVAEMVRAEMVARYGDLAYSEGFKVVTSIDSRLQAAANVAHRDALLDYDERHGYRVAEARHTLPQEAGEEQWAALLTDSHEINGLLPALVLDVLDQSLMVYEPHRGILHLDGPGVTWASKRLADVLARGDVVRIVEHDPGQWRLAQIPAVDGALVSLDPKDGAIRALVGGFDFYSSRFNRVTQAKRQAGSNFKPFLYSAALAKGFTPASLINDAPVVFDDEGLEAAWRPENYSGQVFGPTRLREALVHSRNLVSIRLLRAMGIPYAIDYVSEHFGFDPSRLPRDLSLALGSAAMTPLEIVSGYAEFANGGYRVTPYFIDTIEDADGAAVYRADPPTVCKPCEALAPAQDQKQQQQQDQQQQDQPQSPPGEEPVPQPTTLAPRVLTPQNVYLMYSMMSDVIRRGTGRRALELHRSDIAGKTGTTNDQQDAWFSGFNADLATTAWVGFDQPKPLGEHETGGRAALPMWIDFMREGLKGLPVRPLEQPPGLVTVRIDPDTGLRAAANNPKAIFEIFRVEDVPEVGAETPPAAASKTGPKSTGNTGSAAEELF